MEKIRQKAFAYLRVSTEEQARKGISLGVQEGDIRSYCEENEIELSEIFRDEGVSAGKPIARRPALTELLNRVEREKPELLLLWRLDRLFRRVKDYYTVTEILTKAGTQWFCVAEPDYDTRTATGRLYIHIKLSIAENERDQTGERLSAMFRSRMEQGLLCGGKRTFGYRVQLVPGGRRLVPDSWEAEVVRDCFRHYLSSGSVAETSRWLKVEKGIIRSAKSIQRGILCNTTYIGVRRLLRRGSDGTKPEDVLLEVPDFCEPLVDRETFDLVNRRILRKKKK